MTAPKKIFLSMFLPLTMVFILCSPTPPTENTPPVYSVTVAFPNLSFTRPVDFQQPGDGSGRLFVVEQAGVISVFMNTSSVSSKKTFLDIQSKVDDAGNE